MLRVLTALAALVLGACTTTDAQFVPARFDHGRVFVVATPPGAAPVSFFTDSGGGPNAIRQSTARQLALAPIGTLTTEDGKTGSLVAFPESLVRAGIPAPADDEAFRGGLLAVPDDAFPFEGEGFLGSRWFRDRVWAFDYGRGTLARLKASPASDGAHRVPLAFQTEDGRRTTSFPRVGIVVDGETLDLLFDTGATARLTDQAGTAFGLPGGTSVATSFITQVVFGRWAERHPDWRVLSDADAAGGRRAFAMIEVPRITVAGLEVGPVWFTQRPDNAFHAFMASMMDRPVEGALGGSALKYFRVIVDYPAATATFEKTAR